MRAIRFLLVIAGVAVLAGCSGAGNYADLDAWMAEVKAKPRGKIEPLPEFKAYEAFAYSEASRRAPFEPPIDVELATIEENPDSKVKPNDDRPREYLEGFNLSSLKMVGTLKKLDEATLWGLVSDGAGGVHRVRPGNFLGKDHGRVTLVDTDRIELIEIVTNGHGGWLERPRTLALDEQQL